MRNTAADAGCAPTRLVGGRDAAAYNDSIQRTLYGHGRLVCLCAVPQADPRRNFGMCDLCKRKPLSLVRVTS